MVASRLERHGEVERLQMSRTVAGRAVYWTSVHRIGSVLVDTGCSTARPAFVRYLAERTVTDVLTTHEHEDHIGNHEVLHPRTVVHATAITRRYLEDGHPPFPFYRRFVWGYHGKRLGARAVGARVEAGGRVFRVVPTPGHAEDHVAYLDEAESALFSGDAYMGRFKAARREEDVHAEIASLRRMADVDPATLFPAHGSVVPRPRGRLLETADHFDGLARACRRLAEQGRTPRQIAREVLGRETAITYYSLGEFSNLKMVENLLRPAVR